MQPEDIIRLKEKDRMTKTTEETCEQMFKELGRVLKMKLLTPTEKTVEMLDRLLKIARG